MKFLVFCLSVLAASGLARGALPIVSIQPANQTVLPGGTANFSVAATGAVAFQWRHNGSDIAGATNATLQVTNVNASSVGYYLAIAKNSTGWAPSKMAYLFAGYPFTSPQVAFVPLSNFGSPNAPAKDSCSGSYAPITNGFAQVVAGPELDLMQPVGDSYPVLNGIFDGDYQSITNVLPDQAVYYQVIITHPCFGSTRAQSSTVIKINANDPSAPVGNIKFPGWPEWPEPILSDNSPVYITKIPGEILNFTNQFYGYTDFGTPTCQWRKDGNIIPGATNLVALSGTPWGGYYQAVLTVTNLQAADAGVYDLMVFGNDWLATPTMTLTMQLSNGAGVLQSPHFNDTNFLCDLVGISGRRYALQWSTDLVDWQNLPAASNSSGTITFTNSATAGKLFYRGFLLP